MIFQKRAFRGKGWRALPVCRVGNDAYVNCKVRRMKRERFCMVSIEGWITFMKFMNKGEVFSPAVWRLCITENECEGADVVTTLKTSKSGRSNDSEKMQFIPDRAGRSAQKMNYLFNICWP